MNKESLHQDIKKNMRLAIREQIRENNVGDEFGDTGDNQQSGNNMVMGDYTS